MSESTKNLLNINHLSDKLSNSENFLIFKWDNYSVPVIDTDFFDLFSRLVIKQEVFEFSYEHSKDEIEEIINSGEVTNRLELDKLKKALLRIDELEFEDYLSQNTLALFKNPKFYINRLNESVLHTPLNNNDLDTNLNLIDLKNKMVLSESGLPNLYLTFGFYTADEFNAPLIFIPVKLEKNNDKFKLRFDSYDKIRLNIPLEIKLKEQNITLPKPEINSEADMISYLTAVNKVNTIKPFITLGLFDFTTALALNDLEEFGESDELDNLLKNSDKTIHFNENEIDSIDENDSYNVFDADSSQISAIREALLDGNLFIDAPIGSKKIETIVNLISEIIANKQTVLYVSDKLNEIRETENKLSEIGLEKIYIDLYGNNYNYQSFIDEITNTSKYTPKIEFDKEYTNSRLNELNELKGKLANYSTFINAPFKKTGVTPYHIMGLMESEYSEELDEYEMKNLSNLTNNESARITSDFTELSEFYVNKIYPVAEHKFNYIIAKDITDKQFNDIISTIPNIKNKLDELIKLNNEINEEFGVKKLEKLNNYKNHFKNVESLKNNPQLMGEDYEELKRYVDSLSQYQTKTNEYGSIEELEKKLCKADVYNTRLDLDNQINELKKLNKEITKLNTLLGEFKSKSSDAGIKNLNSIGEVEEINDSLDLLDKNPTVISDEGKLNSFVDDLEKYQSECETNSPEDTLKNINDYSKSTLISTKNQLNTLIEYKNSIEEINRAIDDLNSLKSKIGLNEFKSISNLDDNLKKSDILLSCPILVEDEKAIDDFINLFKTGADKFGNTEYEDSYSKMNDEISEIQDNISDEISKTNVLETNIQTLKDELNNISQNTSKLSKLLNIKKINSIKEIDEYCDNVEILLKNPIIIPASDKSQIDAYITLIQDIQNEEDYTKLNLDDVNELITEISILNKKVKELRFANSVFDLNLKNHLRSISTFELRLNSSPIDAPLSPNALNKKFKEFTVEYNKTFRNPFGGNYRKLKKELKSFYKYDGGPKDDDTIYADYKKYVDTINSIEDVKKEVLIHNTVHNSMETSRFKYTLNRLIELQEEYNSLKKKYNDLVNKSDFDDALDTLVPIKLKLIDIEELSKNADSTLKFKKGVDLTSSIINSKLKLYFPNSYFNIGTNLEELYEEYADNEEYRELVENGFFSKYSLDKYKSNRNEVKTLLTNIKQSKDKFYYILNLIGNNIEIHETSLDIILMCEKPFIKLTKYFNELYNEINNANDLFNDVSENYKIDEIDKLIENYAQLNNLDNVKEFVTTNTYEKTLVQYKDDFRLLNEFNSMSDNHSSLINKYFSNVWKDKSTSLNDLNNTFENHKEFTKLYKDGFFSQNIFKFLEKSDDEIKSTISDLHSKCEEISQKTTNIGGELAFYECNLEEIDFAEYKNQNNEILKTIELLGRYNIIYSHYDENEIIDLDEKADFESLDVVDQLYKDLNKLYNDPEVVKYNISFENQLNNLDKITECKNRFIDLVRLRNSIEDQVDIIQNHFDKLWDGPNTEISIVKNKVAIDKSFTKEYQDGVFTDKTVKLISKDEHSFDDYKNQFISIFDGIKTQINEISSNPIILNEFESELKNTKFDIISQKTSEIKNNIDGLVSNYDGMELSKTFNLDEITLNISILDEIIQSKYIKYLDENLDSLNKSNENLKTSLNHRNELQSLKDTVDGISVDSKYFKDVYNGYETSVSDMNQILEHNKTYEDLFNDGFFSTKTDEIIKDESKLNKLNDSISKMENDVQYLINSFEIFDLIHTEKGINLKKSLDDALAYVTFFDDNLDELKDWIEFEKASKNLDNDVCHEFIKAFYSDEIKPELINQTFTYNFARNMLNEIKKDNTFISDADIEKYAELDKEVIKLNRLRVLKEYVDSRPDFENMESQNPKQYRAYYKFNDLALKNNGDIKEILNDSIEYIKAIKPIFIATPSSVFKYLSSCDFDYIIFNDANQIQSELAITTLLRADKKVIVGDSKQSNIGLVSLIKDKFKTKTLQWCYNDRNLPFYDEGLLVYPKPSEESIFEIVNVDNAVYDISSQINELEAAKIVDLAIEHVNEYGSDKTLGIIAFTKAQRDYIVKLLIEKLEDSPDLVQYFNPLESFYVKYIDDAYESRDVILASLTYGFDSDNVLNIEFESENEYVANKLMTKSSEKTIVLTNLKRKDVAEGNNLKSLFEYQKFDAAKDFELSLFEEKVYNFLNDNNFAVKKQLVDFTINEETSIECEGENFNKFRDVRDKFRLHKELLESLGWKSLHVCTSDWIDNGADYQNKLLDAINTDVEFGIDDDIDFDGFEFDFEDDDEIGINELRELL